MSDYLVELGEKPWFRKAVQTLGLPLPMPEQLERADGPWRKACLSGKSVLTGGTGRKDVAKVLKDAGAADAPAEGTVDALVYDARDAKEVAGLVGLYEFFHNNVRRLGPSGRAVVIARWHSDGDAHGRAAAGAATGFVKSLAKEVGKKGATANAIYVADGGDHNLAGPLRFALSPRSAFVDGQTFYVAKTTKPQKAVAWEQPLKGKTALVTGAARGIGADTARRLAEEGAHVIGLDIPSASEELNGVMDAIGGTPLLVDITSTGAADTILAEAEKHGGLDILVNNAGVTRDKTLANMDRDRWEMALNINLDAALRLSEAALGAMNAGGRVICLSSIAGIAGNFGQTNYAAAKSGLIGAVHALAPAFADKKCTINAVAPGFIETRLTAAIPFVTREVARRLSALGQGGEPRDVAELITFLATPGAAGVNGQVIRVCGLNFVGA